MAGTIVLLLTRLNASIEGENRRHLATTPKHSPQIISSVTLDVWFGSQNKSKNNPKIKNINGSGWAIYCIESYSLPAHITAVIHSAGKTSIAAAAACSLFVSAPLGVRK